MTLTPAVPTEPTTRAPVQSARDWSVEVRRDEHALADLADELRGLYDRSPAATPFQTYEWLRSWWDSYGTPGGLRLALVRCRGLLVAAAPLMAARQWGFPVLVPLARDQSDFTDVLLDPVYLDGAVHHLSRALLAESRWCALDLAEVRPGSMAHLVAQRWPRRTWRLPASVCLELPAGDIAEILRRLPRRTAGKMRAKLRKIDQCGITVEQVPAENAERAVLELLDLHVRQWEGRPINPEHMTERFHRHLAGATAAMVRDGRAAVVRYRRDGRVVASDLVLIGHRFVGAYMYGAVPDLRESVDVTLMLLRRDLDLARERGRQSVSLLRGEEPYKLKWRPEPVQNQRIILARSLPAAVFARIASARARLAAWRHHRAFSIPADTIPADTVPVEAAPASNTVPASTVPASTVPASTGPAATSFDSGGLPGRPQARRAGQSGHG